MNRRRPRLVFVLLVSLLFAACGSHMAGKDRKPQAAEVTVIKPSETKYAKVKVIKPEKQRKRGFLWFGKKKDKKRALFADENGKTVEILIKRKRVIEPERAAPEALELDEEATVLDLPREQVPSAREVDVPKLGSEKLKRAANSDEGTAD